jgi:hypothetical protein
MKKKEKSEKIKELNRKKKQKQRYYEDIENKIQILINKNGRKLTHDEIRILLLCVYQLIRDGMDENEAIAYTSKLLHTTLSTLKSFVTDFNSTETITVSNTSNYGRGSSNYLFEKQIHTQHISSIIQLIITRHSAGLTCTVPMMQKHLQSEFRSDFSIKSIRYHLQKMGFVYGKMESVPQARTSEHRLKRIRSFLYEYAKQSKSKFKVATSLCILTRVIAIRIWQIKCHGVTLIWRELKTSLDLADWEPG